MSHDTFTLLVLRPPGTCGSARRALAFAQALLAEGRVIDRVFFQGDGVKAAQDSELAAGWSAVAARGAALQLCVTSATAAGLDDAGASTGEEPLPKGFEIAGLAQLIVAGMDSRVVTF